MYYLLLVVPAIFHKNLPIFPGSGKIQYISLPQNIGSCMPAIPHHCFHVVMPNHLHNNGRLNPVQETLTDEAGTEIVKADCRQATAVKERS